MARKKYLDERGEEGNHHQHLPKQTHHKYGGNLPMHQGQGGGTKTRKSQEQKLIDDSFLGVKKQLAAIGLTIREMPGDGNCLFRALSDQLCGNSRNHLEYRRAVVQYMRDFRSDFEPFVEDDVPFEKYVNTLAQAGTFAGNDAIVAFSRLHNVTVVIHQLNSPTWLIHPSKDQNHCNGREVHIAYHNGDHYNSVRLLGDDSENPTNIKLLAQEATDAKSGYKSPGKANNQMSPAKGRTRSSSMSKSCTATSVYPELDSSVAYGGRDEDYWVKDNADVERLVQDVMSQTDFPDRVFVRETLLDFNFDIAATVDCICKMHYVMSCSQQDTQEKNKDSGSGSTDHTCSNDQLSTPSSDVHNSNHALSFGKKIVTDMDEQLEDLEESESSASSKDDSDENNPSSPVPGAESSQNKPSSSRKEVRLSSRKKKEIRKRERKRDADQRRRRGPSTDGEQSKENVVVVSNFGSLDI